MTLDVAFCITGVAAEAVVIGLLVHRRVWRTLPVFFAYCVWAVVSDAVAYGLKAFSAHGYGVTFYIVDTSIDFALQLSVLIELAWSVLRPLRANLSPKALPVIALGVLSLGAIIWPFAGISGLVLPSSAWHTVVQMQQTASILRILFFFLLAACSQLLSIGWRDRELQVATGFGFYSLVSLAVAALNTRQATQAQFKHLYLAVAVSFFCSLVYWIFSFAQAEAKRRAFTPQMQQMLLALAASARISRNALDPTATPHGQVS
jgi:hypothetical protein